MNLTYACWLKLPIHPLEKPRKIFNVDGTENKSAELKYYTDLEVQTGTTRSPLLRSGGLKVRLAQIDYVGEFKGKGDGKVFGNDQRRLRGFEGTKG